MQFINIPGLGSIPIYSTLSAFPAIAVANTFAVAADTGYLYEFFNGSWMEIANPTDSVAWGAITGTLSNQTDLQNALNLKAPIASPTFTGTATAPNYSATTSIEIPVITGNPSPTIYGVSGFRNGHTFQIDGVGGGSNVPTQYFISALGTAASPSVITSGTTLGQISFGGMNSTGVSYFIPSTAPIFFQATETWSTSNVNGYNIQFAVQANGTSGNPPGNHQYVSLTLDKTGNIILGGDHHLAPNAYTSDLLWGIDLQGDIGSSDGGTTLFRPNKIFIGSAAIVNGYHLEASEQAISATTSTTTVDLSVASAAAITFGNSLASTSISMNNAVTGGSYLIRCIQGSDSTAVTWTNTIKWAGGTAPVITTTSGKIDLINFYYDGTTFYGSYSQNF